MDNLRERVRKIIGRSFKQGTPYHGLAEIEQLLDEEEAQEKDDVTEQERPSGNA